MKTATAVVALGYWIVTQCAEIVLHLQTILGG